MSPLAQLKRFATNNLLINAALFELERDYNISLLEKNLIPMSSMKLIILNSMRDFEQRLRKWQLTSGYFTA